MTVQNVTVTDVEETSNGWFEITLTDENGDQVVASTKDTKVSEAAFQSRGTEVEAEINTVEKGKFTNVYLNTIAGVGGKSAGKPGAKKSAPAAAIPQKGNDVQERIARQWSYGRAVELLTGSGADFIYPLDEEFQKYVQEQADWLLSQTK